MSQLERRLEKLEAAAIPPKLERWKQVIKCREETDDECIRRHGHDPDEQGLNFIIRVIV